MMFPDLFLFLTSEYWFVYWDICHGYV